MCEILVDNNARNFRMWVQTGVRSYFPIEKITNVYI